MRIARGSGRPVKDVKDMLEEYNRLAKIWRKMKGLKIPKKGEMSALSRNVNAQHMSKVLPPQFDEANGLQGHDGWEVCKRRQIVDYAVSAHRHEIFCDAKNGIQTQFSTGMDA